MKPTVLIKGSAEASPLLEGLAEDISGYAKVVTWMDGAISPTQPSLTRLSESASVADFIVVIITPDDLTSRKSPPSRPRENVIFEIGFFIGAVGSDRILVVDTTPPEQSPAFPADLAGLTILHATSVTIREPRALARIIGAEVSRRMRAIAPRIRVAATEPYSCFISYSHEDAGFAERLFEDLSNVGARCWIDRRELRIGDSLRNQITAAILATDKFLPVLSQASIRSRWLSSEIETALALEQKRRNTVLIPIRVDDTIFSADQLPWVELRSRLIADFRDWQDDHSYKAAFRQLARDLAVSASADRTMEVR